MTEINVEDKKDEMQSQSELDAALQKAEAKAAYQDSLDGTQNDQNTSDRNFFDLETTKHSHKKLISVIIVVAVAGLFLIVMMMKDRRKEAQLSQNQNQTPGTQAPSDQASMVTPAPTVQQGELPPGRIFLFTKNQTHSYVKGSPVEVEIYADTAGQMIGGFDAVLKYDPRVLQYESSENLVREFQFYLVEPKVETPQQTTAYLATTGIMQTSTRKPVTFAQRPVVRVHFTALADGVSAVEVVHKPFETNDSNLVTVDTNDILGFSEGLTLRVGDGVILSEKQSKTTADGYTFTLDKVTKPGAQCADCTTSLDVSVTYGNVKESATFILGGIAGKMSDKKVIQKTSFELSQMSDTTYQIIKSIDNIVR